MNHRDEVLNLLLHQVGSQDEVNEILGAAEEVKKKWVNPKGLGGDKTNGLIYGLVQSGKTGVLTVTGALGADEGYQVIIVLTSDNDALYEQTFERLQESFPGMEILGKNDLDDTDSFLQRVKQGERVTVMTKNGSLLKKLIENFTVGKMRRHSCLIIDDEADQASMNAKARRKEGGVSPINDLITQLRDFFYRNTYLQVTATPQALFLQERDHSFRPQFTVLSHPGAAYVGGEDFFGDDSNLVTEFPLDDLTLLSPGAQPNPTFKIPSSLLTALDTFMVAATYKRARKPDENCAFLCHVSTKKDDHKHIVELLRKYQSDLSKEIKINNQKTIFRVRKSYDDLAASHPDILNFKFDDIVRKIAFYSTGAVVKLVNGDTDQDVAVNAPYSLFVGGNKLGRGVTIKNLLVSYYGRHPKTPQADTVLQHARMYGYRRNDIGLLRLFLPKKLHIVFKAINKMEQALRDLISQNKSEEFRAIYLENDLKPTRKSVLVPGAVGVYAGGKSYNPAQVIRSSDVVPYTKKIDYIFEDVANKNVCQIDLDQAKDIFDNILIDEDKMQFIWDSATILGAIQQYFEIDKMEKINVYIDRDRDLSATRGETQGIIAGSEGKILPEDQIAIFLYRTEEKGKSKAAWWPQVKFPKGAYAFAFSI